MLDTENMQIVSRLLAITLERWCSHRAAKTKQSIAAADGLSQGGGAARLAPLVRIGFWTNTGLTCGIGRKVRLALTSAFLARPSSVSAQL